MAGPSAAQMAIEYEGKILKAWRDAFPADRRTDAELKLAFSDRMRNRALFMRKLLSEGFTREEIADFMSVSVGL